LQLAHCESVAVEHVIVLEHCATAVHDAQTRFCPVFPSAHAVLWYWLAVHVEHEPQTRLLVAVGAVV
jgi:hypothetical protein